MEAFPDCPEIPEHWFMADHKIIQKSYERCRRYNVSPELDRIPDIKRDKQQDTLSRSTLLISIIQHLLSEVHHTLPKKSHVLMVTDTKARILELFAVPEMIYFCSRVGIQPGVSLLEESCGTNAVNLALRYRKPMITRGEQHFCRLFQTWRWIAVPVFNQTGKPQAYIAFVSDKNEPLGEKLPLITMLADRIQRIMDDHTQCIYQNTGADITGLAAYENVQNNHLSPRQHHIISMLISGYSCKEIAATLQISPRTVESHLEKMRDNFGAKTTIKLVATLLGTGQNA